MHIQWGIVLAGAIVGFTVGLTGMGGGALMTPILVIFFNINPTTAVSSDLLAAMIMKPIGGGVHIRRKTIHWDLVKWLCLGSIPTAFVAVFLLHSLGDQDRVQSLTKVLLGITLALAASAMVFKSWLQGRRTAAARGRGERPRFGRTDAPAKPLPTFLIGMVGGTLVGLTSVGSGSVVIVFLLLLYPALKGAELVGTDLTQAIPLVASAAIAHILVGDFSSQLGLAGSLGLFFSILIGSIPAVYVGARVSTKAPDGLIRPALVFVLLASSLKLLNVPTTALAASLVIFAIVAFPIWGAMDAAAFPEYQWRAAGLSREWWIRVQAFGSPFIVGFAAAIAYFAKARPRLTAEGSEGEKVVA
jgi:uncharacterized membrane protein YfcA